VAERLAVTLLAILGLAGCGGPRTAGPVADLKPQVVGLDVLHPKSGGEMVLIPAGTFTMGDPSRRSSDAPLHEVAVGSFIMDKVPVTQELYQRITGVNPSKRKGLQNPVENIQWTDAARFCNKCSELEALSPCYDTTSWACRFDADGYRLPTEAEWEYACRAGSPAVYCCGDDPTVLTHYAWFKPHSGGMTRPVGQKWPNHWGLFDMHGNVWQWCNDFYAPSYPTANSRLNLEEQQARTPTVDPHGPATGTWRVLRGGAWDCPPEKCAAGYRYKEFPVYSDACFGADSYGFRRVRAPREAVKRETKASTLASAATAPAVETRKTPAAATPAPAPVAHAGAIDVARLKGTIAFVSDRSGTLKIWSMHASGRNPVPLTHDANPDADPRFAPDGKRILYTTLRGGFPEVWVMARDGTGATFVTKGAQANWSPDGASIVFIRDNQGFVRELGSGKERRLTPEGWDRCGVPSWSPDGRRIALASRHRGDIGIFLLSPDGRGNTQLEAGEACCTPQWSRDGMKILCQTVQGHIHQVDVDGKNWEQQTFGADVQHDARYSPDGTLILFCRAPTPEGPWQICVKALDGDDSDFVALTREGSNMLPDWHPSQ
jgi:formylglycine-generating enzyme required for sulfatase activity